jgi:hypothetical protein
MRVPLLMQQVRLPQPGRRYRLAVIVYGVAVFWWLGPEDSRAFPPALLGWIGVALTLGGWLLARIGGRVMDFRALMALGAASGGVIGLGASVGTGFLMFFKNARHAHVLPDFPTAMISAILARAPVWSLAGALIGLGIVLAWAAVWARSPDDRSRTLPADL